MYRKILDNFVWFGGLLLLAYMPFHIFLSQSVSVATGGLDAWKIGKDVLLYTVAAKAFFVCLRAGYLKRSYFRNLTILFVAYALLHVLVAVAHPHNDVQDTLLGIVYNLRLAAAFYIGAAMSILRPQKQALQTIIRVMVVAAAAVAVLGVVQYYLPKDTLMHVGYSTERGVKPNFFIDDKPDLPRVMSTMRDPNTLGAFLLLPIVLLVARLHATKRKKWYYAGIIVMIVCLLLTFSRSAVLGLSIAFAVYALLQHTQQVKTVIMKYKFILVTLLLVVCGFLYVVKSTYFVQNTLLHSDRSTRQRDSNGLHLDFAKNAVKKIAQKPIGHGPGTAGLVSIRSQESVVLTENYYLQIAYEVGVIGLIIFVGIIVLVAKELWRLRYINMYAIVLLSVLAGLSFINLLLHMWSGEALVLYWWLFAGAVIFSSNKKLSGSKK